MTTRKGWPAFAVIFAMLLAATVLFAAAAQPAWAESDNEELTPKAEALQDKDSSDEDGSWNVHVDPTVFMKNYDLTAAQKQYTITEIEKVLSEIIDPDMSDLEKYYRIAVWVNDRVEYDSDFWSGGYNFDYYSHQWDAYGGMKEDEMSVCVGIAIFYANMCHAADLPCRVVRLDPTYLDHTINFIPDINGHAYYADVTENVFFMTDISGSSFTEKADKRFANITQASDDHSFDYREDGQLKPPPLKDENRNYALYGDWFKEFALHKDTDKIFETPYEEHGSGLNLDDPSEDPKPYHASYSDVKYYPSQDYYDYSKKTSVHKIETPHEWFMDDFYKDRAAIKELLSEKVLDKEILNVSGVKKNYNVGSKDELLAAVAEDISVEMFPSMEGNKCIPRTTELQNGVDYTIECEDFDPETTHEVELKIRGKDQYKGDYAISVTLNSAAFTKEPVQAKSLTYTGEELQLVQPGKAKIGSMPSKVLYAVLDNEEQEPTEEDFSAAVPSAVNAGKYFIWYKALGGDGYADSPVERLERPVTIAPCNVEFSVDDKKVKIGKTVTLSPRLEQNLQATFSFESDDPSIATVNSKGVVKGVRAGYVDITVHAQMKDPNYTAEFQMATIHVVKFKNPIKVKGKTVKIKAKALKKKAKSVKRSKAITVKKAKGKLSYKLVSAKKGSKSFKKKFLIDADSGKITVKKGLKKGTYKVRVKVKAKGNARYKKSSWKKVTFTVRVR